MPSTVPPDRRAATARKKAEFLAAQRKAERRRRVWLAVIPIGVVAVVVLALVIVSATSTDKKAAPTTTASSQIVSQVTSVPAAALNQAGLGGITSAPVAIDGATATQDGKPRILYVGAEYCPYCAAERWPLIVALSRFGTFSGLRQTTSSASDVYPNTPTLSFHGATYTSQYLQLTAYETTTNQPQGNGYAPLDKLSAADEAVTTKYNAPPYFQSAGGIPFALFAGQYASSGSLFDPGLLTGLSREQIAASLSDPASKSGKPILGAANLLTAVLCKATGGQPASVCTQSGVASATGKLPSRSSTS